MKKPFSRFLSCIVGLFVLLSFNNDATAQVQYLQNKDAILKLNIAVDTETNNLQNGVYSSVSEQTEIIQQIAFYKQVADAILESVGQKNTDEVISTVVPQVWYKLSDLGIEGPIGMTNQQSDNSNFGIDDLRIETRTLLAN